MAIAPPEPLPSVCLLADDLEKGEGCEIGGCVVIESGVRLGDRVRIGEGVFIGEGSRVGDDTRIGARVTIREHSWIGKRVLVEAGACLGADGFGFAQRADGTQFKIPQAGIVEIGDDCWVGARATIDRATLGKTLLGEGVKIGPQVMVGHNVVLGEGCEFEGQCGVSGSTRVGARTFVGAHAGLVGHLEVGEGCRIEAYTGVTKKLAPGTHIKGVFPAMAPEQFDRQQELVAQLPDLVERLEKLETKTAQAV